MKEMQHGVDRDMVWCVQDKVKELGADVILLQSDLSDRDGIIATDFQTMREQRERINNLESHNFVLKHKAQVPAI